MKNPHRFVALATLFMAACGVAAGNPDRPTGKLYIDKRYPPAATAGTPLTLVGRNFGAEQGTVRIGSQSVNVLSWSADKVVVETPSSETTACESVRVVSADGEKSNVVPYAYGNQNLWIPNSDVPIGRTRALSVWSGEQMIIWGGDTNTGGRYNPLTDSWLPISTVGAPGLSYFFDRGAAFWTGKEMLVLARKAVGSMRVEFQAAAKYDPEIDTWSVVVNDQLPAGDGASAVWTGKEMIVWGEHGGARFDPVADRWSPLGEIVDGDDRATKPLKRKYHTAVWTGTEMIIWGGEQTAGVIANGARYNPKTDRWVPIASAYAPSARTYHLGVWTGEEMIVWGGADKGLLYSDSGIHTSGARYNPRTDSWSPMSMKNAPLGGIGASSIWTGTEWLVYGGQAEHYFLGAEAGGASYDPGTNQWTPLPTANQPGGRALATADWTGSEMLLWGGVDEFAGLIATGGRFNVQHRKWTPITGVAGEPQQGAGFSVAWTGTEMIIWGGYTSPVHGSDIGGRYDPVMNQWRATSRPPAGLGRAFHEAVWTGSAMLITPAGDLPGLSYSPKTDTWATMTMAGAPTIGSFPGAVWTGEKMIVWGESNGGMYEPRSDTWFPMSSTGAPSFRRYTRPVWTGKEMLLYGGGEEYGFIAPNGGDKSGGRFNPTTNEWTPLPTAEFLNIDAENATVWTGKEFVIIGRHASGEAHSRRYELQGGRYNPDSNEWKPLNLTGAPIGQFFPTYFPNVVWTGQEILLFSEPSESDVLPSFSGVRYNLENDEWTPIDSGCSAYVPIMFKMRGLLGAAQRAVWTGTNVQLWGLYGGFTFQP